MNRDPSTGQLGGTSPRSYGSRYSETVVTATDALGLLAQRFWPMHDDNGAGNSVTTRVKLGTWATGRTGPNWRQANNMGTGNEAIRVYAEISRTSRSSGKIFILKRTEFDLRYTDQNGNTGQKATLVLSNTRHNKHVHHFHVKRRKHHHHDKPPHTSGHVEPGHMFEVSLHQGDLLRSVQSMVFKSGEYQGSIILTLWGERPILQQGTSGTQIAAMLDDFGWPPAMRSIGGGSNTLIPQSPWGSSGLEVAQEIMDAELGQLYVNRQGVIVFQGRKARYNAWPSSPTLFGDQPGTPSNPTSELPYGASVSSRDVDNVYNDVRVTRVGIGNEQPAPQRRVDGSSRAAYGWRTLDRDTLVTTDVAAGKQANWILETQKTPLYRVSTLDVLPYRDPARLFPAMRTLDISSPLRVRERMPNSTRNFDYWVEAVNESGSASAGWRDYTVEFTLSPRIMHAPY